MLMTKYIFESNVVLVQQGFHPGPVLGGQANTQWGKYVSNDLAKYQVDGQGRPHTVGKMTEIIKVELK